MIDPQMVEDWIVRTKPPVDTPLDEYHRGYNHGRMYQWQRMVHEVQSTVRAAHLQEYAAWADHLSESIRG